jgi:hypothetical protein
MRLPRYKIRTLLGVVLFVAIAVAALRAADEAWDGGFLGLALLILLTAVLLGVHRTERKRAYWLGFALFGWAYLIASLIPPIGSRLPTTMGLALIDSKIPGRQRAWVTSVLAYTSLAGTNPVQGYVVPQQVNTLVSSPQGGVWLWDATTGKPLAALGGSSESFIRIGHSLLALALAFLGGHLSRYLWQTGQGRSSNDRPISSSPL